MKKVKIFFYCYLILFIVLVVIKFDGSLYSVQNTIETIQWNRDIGIINMNLIPFRTLVTQGMHMTSMWAIKNLIGNIVTFIPLGCLLPIAYKTFRNIIPFLIITITFILCIEIIQFIFMIGFFDVDDIILNFVGAIVGYVLYFFNKKIQGVS